MYAKFGQNPLKDVDPRVFTRRLWKDGKTEGRKEGRKEGRTDGRTDGRVTISLRNFVGKGIIKNMMYRYFTKQRTHSFVDVLQDIVDSYIGLVRSPTVVTVVGLK